VVLYGATAPLDGPLRRDRLAELGDAEEQEPRANDDEGDAGDRKVAHDHGGLRLLLSALLVPSVRVVAASDHLVDRDHHEAHEHDGAVARDEEVVHPGEVVDLRHPLDEHELSRGDDGVRAGGWGLGRVRVRVRDRAGARVRGRGRGRGKGKG
jgi:hypothetical protein